MKREIAERWISALRSGEYKQTTDGVMRTGDDKFCVLGVLCDLHSQETNQPWQLFPNGRYHSYHYRSCTIPHEVALWAGLDCNQLVHLDNIGTSQPNTRSVSALNDSGVSFEELANLIEKQL